MSRKPSDSIEPRERGFSTAPVAMIAFLAKITVREPAPELKVSGEARVSDAAVRLE